jgi:Gamma-glutamyl cyclotransferase, AIG2-like
MTLNQTLPADRVSDPKRVAAFFYGSFMRREVMAKGNFFPNEIETAKLNGFDIHVEPHANISRSDQHSVFGILVHPTDEELNALYSMDGVGVFLPEAVIVETNDGRLQPALCYIPPTRNNHPADLEYLGNLIAVATEYGFPHWYIERLASLGNHR